MGKKYVKDAFLNIFFSVPMTRLGFGKEFSKLFKNIYPKFQFAKFNWNSNVLYGMFSGPYEKCFKMTCK